MKQLIEIWLSGIRNYTAGTILYRQYGTDKDLLHLFDGPKTQYRLQKLADALQQLINPQQEQQQPAQAIVEPYTPMPDAPDNDVLTAIKNQWMPLYTEMNYKRHQLDQYLDDESPAAMKMRAKLAMEILINEQKCMAAWQQRDYYLKHRQLPGNDITADDEPIIDQFKAGKRLQTLQVYIRRYKAKIKYDTANPVYPQKLNQYQKEYDILKSLDV